MASQYGIDAGGGTSDPSHPIPLWGSDLHRAVFEHQLLSGSPLACLADRSTFHGGDDSTVNVGPMDLDDDLLTQTAGPSYRQVVDLGALQGSLYVHPMGQSGAEMSQDYESLLPLWAQGRYRDMITDQGLVDDAATMQQTFMPA